jgi:hypothetical protein
VSYLTFFLKDSQNENIECLFYRAIEFILQCQKSKANVLVHCIQGVSRSVTVVLAFIIFKYGYDYKKAELFVKQKRPIACPNNGFMVELIQFHKRLYDDLSSLPSPRVFLLSAHSPETPALTTARMVPAPPPSSSSRSSTPGSTWASTPAQSTSSRRPTSSTSGSAASARRSACRPTGATPRTT